MLSYSTIMLEGSDLDYAEIASEVSTEGSRTIPVPLDNYISLLVNILVVK